MLGCSWRPRLQRHRLLAVGGGRQPVSQIERAPGDWLIAAIAKPSPVQRLMSTCLTARVSANSRPFVAIVIALQQL
jgi:hypothetical protein